MITNITPEDKIRLFDELYSLAVAFELATVSNPCRQYSFRWHKAIADRLLAKLLNKEEN